VDVSQVFDNFVLWGHESLPDSSDPHLKGVEEWIKFAAKVHTASNESSKPGKTGATSS
jgi:ribonuclease H2 subunit C